jgi:hypothetical protein
VDDVCRVNVLHAAKQLVEEELDVEVGEGLARPHNLVQVGLHGLHVEVSAISKHSTTALRCKLTFRCSRPTHCQGR